MSGVTGLAVGDQITHVNRNETASVADVRELLAANQPGVCLPSTLATVPHTLSPRNVNCCSSNLSASLCFFAPNSRLVHTQFACVHVRTAFQVSNGLCYHPFECKSNDEICWTPVVTNPDRLVEFAVKSPSVDDKKVFFVGDPSEVLRSVKFRDASDRFYVPRQWIPSFLTPFCVFLSAFASFVESFCYTTAVVSLTLAFFNVLPISLTDGAHVWKLFFERYVFSGRRKWKRYFPLLVWTFNALTITVLILTWLRGNLAPSL